MVGAIRQDGFLHLDLLPLQVLLLCHVLCHMHSGDETRAEESLIGQAGKVPEMLWLSALSCCSTAARTAAHIGWWQAPMGILHMQTI